VTGDVLTTAWPSCTLQLSENLLFDTDIIDTNSSLQNSFEMKNELDLSNWVRLHNT